MNKIISAIIFFSTILYFCTISFAETIILKSGKTIEGKITERTDEYIKIDFEGVPLTYFLDDITSIDGIEQSTGPGDKIKTICNKFCSGAVNIDYNKTDYSRELVKNLSELKIDDLSNDLVSNVYLNNQIPMALQYLGLKLMQDAKIDDSLKIYKCAAENYYEMVSMYTMAMIYSSGTDSIKEQFPNAVITNEIKPDLQKEYFWLVSLLYVEKAEKTGLLSADTELGWNAIAMLDKLQNAGKLSDQEMVDIENDAREFIGKRYPEVLNDDDRVFYHKLSEIINRLQ